MREKINEKNMINTPKLHGFYKSPTTVGILFQQKKIPSDAELSYANNPNSLFRKYSQLVTWFSNESFGRNYLAIPHYKERIGLLTPNGYHLVLRSNTEGFDAYFEFSTRAIYAPFLYEALIYVDRVSPFLRDFDEAKEILLWALRIHKGYPPAITYAVLFNTSTFYPDADAETTSVDGWVARLGVDQTYSNVRSGAGTNSADSETSNNDSIGHETSTTSGQWAGIRRGIFLYDTSSLPDDATITSSTLSIHVPSKFLEVGFTSGIFNFTSAAPASNTALAATDYPVTNFGSTKFATGIAYASITAGAYNDWTLNASGLTNISQTGISKFGLRIEADIDNSPPTWQSNSGNRIGTTFADTAGTTSDPKLVVDYTTTSTSTSTSTTTTSTSTTTTSTSTTTTSTSTTTTSTSSSTTTTSSSTSSSSSTSTSTTTTSTTVPYLKFTVI